jgi:CheY-like chemotaxis protein
MGDRHQTVTIVMIEDDEGHARLIEKNIRRAGVCNEIVGFDNGTAALEYLRPNGAEPHPAPHRPLLILLDLNLPDMTGMDILAQLKANDHTRRFPIIVLTTTDDSREIAKCYDLGANVYITKPMDYDNFANAIRQLGMFLSVIQIPEMA